jgi:hypothetical protein
LFADLKSYFSRESGSSNCTTPSTRGSGVGLDDALAIPIPEEEVQGQENESANEQGIIIEFNPDHVISDPGFRIPIDQFSPNIRDEIRRTFMKKVQLNLLIIVSLKHQIKGAFK